jgi:DNA-binding beta-propeller fold protein YncE
MQNRRSGWVFTAAFIFIVSFIGGCVAPPPEPLLVYPSPPDEPRLVYLKSYTGSLDYRKSSVFDSLLGVPTNSDFSRPYGVYAIGGNIYVTDMQLPGVVIFDSANKSIRMNRDTALPLGVVATPDGTYFVSDAKRRRVFGFDAQGKLKLSLGVKEEFKNPAGLALNSELGRLYVVDSYGHMVFIYSLAGEKLGQFGGEGTEDGMFHFPTNAAVDRRNGNVCIVDTQNFRVQIFDKDGKFIKKFGELGDIMGTFSRPKGIGVDSEGHIYVADAAFDNFQIFDENGQLLLFIGRAGSNPGYFELPAGLFVDEQDKVYVVDSFNKRVQVFQYLSEKWKQDHPDEYKKYALPGADAGQKAEQKAEQKTDPQPEIKSNETHS